ncbi:hypothetical protein KOW79_003287 [Hemibagrus wyckioides]|uniref:Uncharacterized protein n=1 Tax=Hemibagrus wyckioides TaxID=337641 RepID=A0A9D3P642_9TELE|nr:hypothetical protein KOW79_003287 [Hemibagrus wyckioides]
MNCALLLGSCFVPESQHLSAARASNLNLNLRLVPDLLSCELLNPATFLTYLLPDLCQPSRKEADLRENICTPARNLKSGVVLQSQARREIAAHKWDSSSTAETVFNVLGHLEISVTGLKEGTDGSTVQLMGIQQSMEPSEDLGPSTSQVYNPQPQPVYQISLPAAATHFLLDRKL